MDSEDADTDEMLRLWKRMNSTQRQYVTARVEGKNIKSAASQVEYTDNATKKQRKGIRVDSAYDLEKHPLVSRYLYLSARAAVRRTLVTRTDVIEGLLDAVESAGSSTELVQAWRELGKIVGAYEPAKVEVTMKVEELDRGVLTRLPTKQLLEMAAQNGQYVLPKQEDPMADEFELIRDALEPPKPLDYVDG